MAGPLANAPSNVFGILSNADFPYPTVTLSDGRQVTLNRANFTAYRGVPNRKDRETVMSAFFNALGIDLFPTPGKRSGAYSNGGAYDIHPYMLINYNGKYEDVSTMAHELGHTMQRWKRFSQERNSASSVVLRNQVSNRESGSIRYRRPDIDLDPNDAGALQ